MIESIYERAHALRRLRSACTGSHIDEFAAALLAQGYAHVRVRDLVRGVAHLGHWLDRECIGLADLDEALIATFVAHLEGTEGRGDGSGKRGWCRSGALRFLAWARECGIVSTSRPTLPIPVLIREFEEWMTNHRNISAVTLKNYRLPLRRFLEAAGDDPGLYDAAGIRSYILAESQRAGSGYAKLVVSALRMFLRFLTIVGLCASALVGAVPTIADWKLSALPRYVSQAEIERIVGACDLATVAGRRDRAMLLLMVKLGLRAGDVVGLCLGDIDWGDATVTVSGKGRRSVRMPLPQDVGDAILLWLAQGRPDSGHERVFQRLRAPRRPITNVVVNDVVVRAARRAGLALPRIGPHVLRHSMATALLNEGVSLPAIGALLRHRNLDTTMIYAKVDVSLLKMVARPWPTEVAS